MTGRAGTACMSADNTVLSRMITGAAGNGRTTIARRAARG